MSIERFPYFVVAYDANGEPVDVGDVDNEQHGYEIADGWVQINEGESTAAIHHATIWKATRDGFEKVNTLTRVEE